MKPQHREMAKGRWWELTLAEQLGHIGSEVSRTLRWRSRDDTLATGAIHRALELFDLTLADPRHRRSVARLREIARAREVFLDFVVGPNGYASTAESLQRYFDVYAVAARRR